MVSRRDLLVLGAERHQEHVRVDAAGTAFACERRSSIARGARCFRWSDDVLSAFGSCERRAVRSRSTHAPNVGAVCGALQRSPWGERGGLRAHRGQKRQTISTYLRLPVSWYRRWRADDGGAATVWRPHRRRRVFYHVGRGRRRRSTVEPRGPRLPAGDECAAAGIRAPSSLSLLGGLEALAGAFSVLGLHKPILAGAAVTRCGRRAAAGAAAHLVGAARAQVVPPDEQHARRGLSAHIAPAAGRLHPSPFP